MKTLCPKWLFISAFITVCALGLLSGCSFAKNTPTAKATKGLETATPAVVLTSTASNTPNLLRTYFAGLPLTETAKPSPTRTITLTVEPSIPSTRTPIPSPTAPLLNPDEQSYQAGTALPDATTPIQADNLNHLVKAAQWGKGSINRIAYSPDGKWLYVGSAFGFAVYATSDFSIPPQWLAFPSPLFYESVQFSQDGDYLRLQWPKSWPEQGSNYRIFEIKTQTLFYLDFDHNWIISPYDAITSYRGVSILSPDKTVRFEGSTGYPEGEYNVETFSGAFFDNLTGEILYGLKDQGIYVHYDDYTTPDGCDLASFSYCGNVYDPNIMAPYRSAFSPTGRTLAILYRAPNLWNTQNFSLLRVYSTKDGSLINTFGSFDQPVQDFAYQPGSDNITAAFVNGSIQLWDPTKDQLLHQRWDFTPPLGYFSFSRDGRYLLAQSSDTVEVWRNRDGAILGRYNASAMTLSPKANLLALGGEDGSIRVEDLDRLMTVSRMQGHTAEVYALAFSPDGQALVSSSEDCSIRSWDVATGQFQHYFEKAEVDVIGEGWTQSRIFVYYMEFLPDSKQLLGFGSWGTTASWNIDSGVKQYTVVSQPLQYYNGMQTLNPHFPQSFWVRPEEGRFYVDETGYDLASGEFSGGYTAPAGLPVGCSPVGATSADGALLFTPGYDDLSGQVCVLDAADNRLLWRIAMFPENADLTIQIRKIFLSPDGTRLFVASTSGAVFVYQVK